MTEIVLLIVCAVLAVTVIALLISLKKKSGGGDDEKIIREIKRKSELDDLKNKALIDSLDRAINSQTNVMVAAEERLNKTLKDFSDKNEKQLAEMRYTVDEKLNATLEQRLASSYNIIAENLNKVAIGIGEVNKLADSVGDIKRVFTNVKVRGTWGEIMLDSLLGEMLSKEQYVKNCRLNPAVDAFVDFAVLMPDKSGVDTYLPIDSKFPIEEYNRLAAADTPEAQKLAEKGLATAVKRQADSIREKYIYPPLTTDFAIMYFPVEGLFAEVIKNDELSAYLHARRVMPCGPTNLGALLNALQVGFKTVAIENRSRELWQLLSVFKSEFIKFSALLEKTGKKLQEAQESIDLAAKRTKTIERKLKTVEISGSDSEIEPEFPINDE